MKIKREPTTREEALDDLLQELRSTLLDSPSDRWAVIALNFFDRKMGYK